MADRPYGTGQEDGLLYPGATVSAPPPAIAISTGSPARSTIFVGEINVSDKMKRTDLLTKDQVKTVAEGVRRLLGDQLLDKPGQYGIDLHDSIAFGSVAAQVQQAREAGGLSLKDLARELHVPQYRIRDVEGSRINEIQPDVLRRVIERLDLAEWYVTWVVENADLARRIT